jgi:hypothetical protein
MALLHSYYQGIIYGTREANQNGTSHSSTPFDVE